MAPDDLQQALLEVRPHIVHFSGHGTRSEEILVERAGGGSIGVEKEPFVELFGILKTRSRVHLVVLNACLAVR